MLLNVLPYSLVNWFVTVIGERSQIMYLLTLLAYPTAEAFQDLNSPHPFDPETLNHQTIDPRSFVLPLPSTLYLIGVGGWELDFIPFLP